MILLQPKFIHTFFKKRLPESHKGHHGHAFLVAGNSFRMGASCIAAKACLRSGCGLLTVDVPKEERFILQTFLPEAMLKDRTIPLNHSERISAIGIGPALGMDEPSHSLLKAYLHLDSGPMVIDADAITLLAQHQELWQYIKPGTIFTPHVKEFDRLFGAHTTMKDRYETAIEIAREKQIVLVLKNYQTYITNGKEEYLNSTGNAGLAKGGSGDALFGMIVAFLAQGYEPLQASLLACYLHGLAADIAVKKQSEESLLISDVIESLGEAFRRLY